jgi:hypothetical protein
MRLQGEWHRASRGDGVRRRAGGELDAEFVAFVDRRARRHLHTAALLTGDWHTAEAQLSL